MATPNATQQNLLDNISACKDQAATLKATLTTVSAAASVVACPNALAKVQAALAVIAPQATILADLYSDEYEIAHAG